MRTYQDHIDPLISKIKKCGAHGLKGHTPEVVVLFTNDTWVCSSGHLENHDNVPTLRRPELDPVAWMRSNVDRIGQRIKVKTCVTHSENAQADWGYEGHLYGATDHLALCLPALDRPV